MTAAFFLSLKESPTKIWGRGMANANANAMSMNQVAHQKFHSLPVLGVFHIQHFNIHSGNSFE